MFTIACDRRRGGVRWSLVCASAVTAMLVTFAGKAQAVLQRWDMLTQSDIAPIRCITVDPQDPSTIYVGISNGAIAFDPGAYVPAVGAGIVKSIDAGMSWSPINFGLDDLNVVAIVVDPQTSSTVYAATDGGGVFKSINGGLAWAPRSNGLPDEGEVYALAMDPLTPLTLYAGMEHDGVFKSTDGGASWTAAVTGLDVNSQTLETWALAVDPQTPTTLYAGTRGGVFKSTNAAGSWAPTGGMNWVNYVDGSPQASHWVYALAIDPVNSQTVYAGVLDAGGVFRSDNGGTTWSNATAGIDYLAGYSYITSLTIDPNDPNTLYAGTQDRGVFKTTDRGGRWAPLNMGLSRQGVWALALDSQHPPEVYAGTVLGSVVRLGDAPIALDHFRCFSVRGDRVDVPDVLLTDDLETRTTSVGRPKLFCEPTGLSGSDVIDATANLVCYSISRNSYAGPQAAGFDTQLSQALARNLKPAALCVPSERDGVPSALNLDHFKSYRSSRIGTPLFAITLDDALGSQDAKFYRSAGFMTPVAVNGGAVADPDADLACYELRYKQRGFEIAEPVFVPQQVTIDNEFGTQTLDIIEPTSLCLASQRIFLVP